MICATHHQESEEDGDDVLSEETPVIGFWSGIVWLVGMTAVIALLSEFVVGTIEVTYKLSCKRNCS